MTPDRLVQLLETSASRHSHLCPRQVLGVRIGLAGSAALGLEPPRRDKRLLVILETDGCFADGVEVATSCTVGHRTLRIEDYGRIAATFVDVKDGRALRVAPRQNVRQLAWDFACDEPRRYFAQLHAYQIMPISDLLQFQAVTLVKPVEQIVSVPGVRIDCDICGEEIINERQVSKHGLSICLACAGEAYYQVSGDQTQLPHWLSLHSIET